jgi:hypothetical protein
MTRFNAVETYEPGDTVMFTWVASTAPDAAPLFSVFDPSSNVVASLSSTQSDSTHYYALFTMPASGPTHYVSQFRALKTVSGSAYQVISRDSFRVRSTDPMG